MLDLWISDSLQGRFSPHPQSPIRIGHRGSRMAGAFQEFDGRLMRFGQDFQRKYGDGLLAFEVLEVSPDKYREKLLWEFKFDDRHGPHTIDFYQNNVVLDWYREELSAFAFARRVFPKLKKFVR